MLETYLQILDKGYYEVKFAFDGLADENVWKRPANSLLSIGELAGHIAYWEAVKFAGEGARPQPDLTKCSVKSLLIDHRFQYYSTNIALLPSDEHLTMTAEQVCSELLRVHSEAMSYFKTLNPDLDSTPPGWSAKWTYRAFLS